MTTSENTQEWKSVAPKTPFVEDPLSPKAVEFGVSS